MKAYNIILIVTLFSALVSVTVRLWGPYVFNHNGPELEQKIRRDSHLNNKCYVSTQVWFYEDHKLSTLEYDESTRCDCPKSDSIKGIEYAKAMPIYNKLKEL